MSQVPVKFLVDFYALNPKMAKFFEKLKGKGWLPHVKREHYSAFLNLSFCYIIEFKIVFLKLGLNPV